VLLPEKGGHSATSPRPAKDGVEELDQVAGNTEDEIGDLIQSVKEDEMMFSEHSLLADFGPMIQHICLNPKAFKVCLIIDYCRRAANPVSEPSS
jgi:condensin complex subunit 1